MTRRSWLVLGASLGAELVLLGFSLRGRAVPAAALVRGTAVEAVYASGTVEPVLRAEVRARAGGPLLELHVTHDVAFAKRASRQVSLKDGRAV